MSVRYGITLIEKCMAVCPSKGVVDFQCLTLVLIIASKCCFREAEVGDLAVPTAVEMTVQST